MMRNPHVDPEKNHGFKWANPSRNITIAAVLIALLLPAVLNDRQAALIYAHVMGATTKVGGIPDFIAAAFANNLLICPKYSYCSEGKGSVDQDRANLNKSLPSANSVFLNKPTANDQTRLSTCPNSGTFALTFTRSERFSVDARVSWEYRYSWPYAWYVVTLYNHVAMSGLKVLDCGATNSRVNHDQGELTAALARSTHPGGVDVLTADFAPSNDSKIPSGLPLGERFIVVAAAKFFCTPTVIDGL